MKGNFVRRLATVGMIPVVALAGGLVAASPAHAVPGIQMVSASSASNSQSPKSVNALCPAGTVVLDGGGYIRGGNGGQVRLSGMRQINALFATGFQVTATEDTTGYAGNWQLFAYAICAPTPAGWQLVSSTSATNSQSWRAASVSCPSGKKVIGAGATVNNGGAGVELHVLLPSADLTSVGAQAYEVETGYGGSWSLTAYAVCANPLPGLVRVTGTPLVGSGTVAGVACPPGTKVHGLGGLNNAALGEVFIVALYPAGALTSATIISAEDETGTPIVWQPLVYAICAN